MNEFLAKAFALTMVAAIHQRLDAAAVIGMGTPYLSFGDALRTRKNWYRAAGSLQLRTHNENGETSAPVQIFIYPQWHIIPPRVFCTADYIRREIDWHVQMDGSLCHVMPDQWSWHLKQWWDQGMRMDQLIDVAATWCCQNVDSLITRHLHGYRIGLTKWPKAWGQWSHYQKGIEEFYGSLNKDAIAA